MHLYCCCVPVLLLLPLRLDISVEKADFWRTASLPVLSPQVPSTNIALGAQSLEVLLMPGRAQPWSFRLWVAKAQLLHQSQTSGAAHYSSL